MLRYLPIALQLSVITSLLLASSGCQLEPGSTYRFAASPSTARVLERLEKHLRAARAEMSLRCERAGECSMRIADRPQPAGSELEAEVVKHPFKGYPMLLRVHGGSKALQQALYDALGAEPSMRQRQMPTKNDVTERVVLLEGEQIKFRCESTPECWTLIDAKLLK